MSERGRRRSTTRRVSPATVKRSGASERAASSRATSRRSGSVPAYGSVRAAATGSAERQLAAALVHWFHEARRTLPWREDYAPYAVWISEMMLQQTQVETVLPYYRRWMERFPTVAAVAEAPVEAVLKAWEGLGYYGRARNLHRTAVALVEQHGGRLPDDAEALRALPGVGPYTAGAIASIAFNRPEPIVDGNVARVLGRLFALSADPATPEGKRAVWATSAALLASARAGGSEPRTFNEALMELGALVCRPRAPQCLLCPWQDQCRARLNGNPEKYPPRRARKTRPVRRGVMLLVRRPADSGKGGMRDVIPGNEEGGAGATRGHEWLLRRRPPRGIWGGLWEFPWAEQQGEEETEESLCAGLLTEGNVANPASLLPTPVGHISHGLTHFQLELECWLLDLAVGPPARSREPDDPPARMRWVTPLELAAIPLARLSHKALALVGS